MISLHQNTFETTLKEGSAFLSEAIESSREYALKPLHAYTQVWFRSSQGQVVVIVHDAIGMENPIGSLARLEKTFSE
jgi:hypothetical protein